MTVSRSAHDDKRTALIPLSEYLLLDEPEAATICGVSRPTFRTWVQAGYLQRVRLPFGIKRNLFKRSDLLAFVASLEAEADALAEGQVRS